MGERVGPDTSPLVTTKFDVKDVYFIILQVYFNEDNPAQNMIKH